MKSINYCTDLSRKFSVRFMALYLAILIILASSSMGHRDYASAAIMDLGPISWDIFRNPWSAAVLPMGVQLHQTASTDPQGLNHDNYHCQKILPQHACLLAEASGAGEIDSIWTTRHDDLSHTGDLTIILDGKTVVHAPMQDIVNGRLGAPFIYPIVANAHQSSGGNYIIAPMTYHSSMQVFTEHDPEYYHLTYSSFHHAPAVPTFNPHDAAWDIIHQLLSVRSENSHQKKFIINAQANTKLVHAIGAGILQGWTVSLPQLSSLSAVQRVAILRHINLRITVDGVETMNIPLEQFFGAAAGDFPVRAALFQTEPRTGSYTSFWPMPFAHNISLNLVNYSTQQIHGAIFSHIRYDPIIAVRLAQHRLGYFRVSVTNGGTHNGQDFEFFHTPGRGKFLGFVAQLKGNANHQYLEGNEHIYYDGAAVPQINGTGTEDLFEAGWYFRYGPFSNPLNGETYHQIGGSECGANTECISAYRIYLSDAIPFQQGIVAAIQHGPTDNIFAHYIFTNFWYSTQP